MFYQQGDVLLIPTNKVQGKKLDHLTLAEGEVTGHTHRISEGLAELFENGSIKYLRVKSKTATIGHEEHKPVTLPAGDYEVRIVREYSHFDEEAKSVVD
jgi:hypothetical protein